MCKREYPELRTVKEVDIACRPFPVESLPEGVRLLKKLGIAAVGAVDGYVVHRADIGLYEVRAVITPGGDYLVMFPAGYHYASSPVKMNEMLMYRSHDRGESWIGPERAFHIDYNQHGFIPLIPRGSDRIYCFGTQPVWEKYDRSGGRRENAPIGYFYSDDDGHTWAGPVLIEPENDPQFKGMSVTRMCETDRGTWLLGAHEADWSYSPLHTRQYLLRSEDQGKSWQLLPGKRPEGWWVEGYSRMDEGRVLNLGGDRVLFMIRTPEGHLWASWSEDDGKTWSSPEPTSLIQPDAPPMIELLPDGKTIVCLHHNRHHDVDYLGLDSDNEPLMKDRTEVWVSLSKDGGKTFSEPGYLFSNAAEPDLENAFRNHQCSYIDMFADGDMLHLFVPHRWQQVLHLTVLIEALPLLPSKRELLEGRKR